MKRQIPIGKYLNGNSQFYKKELSSDECESKVDKKNTMVKHQRKKEACVNYDFKKNQCMCSQSGMFTMPCNSINSCEYYSEFSIYVVPTVVKKNKNCPCCGGEFKMEVIPCTYQKDNGAIVHNQLQTYRCENCERNYMAKTAFDTYVLNKDIDKLDVNFEMVDKECCLLNSIE